MPKHYEERKAEIVNLIFIFSVLTIMTVVLFFGSKTMTGAVILGFQNTTSDNLELNFEEAGSKIVNLSLYNKTYYNANLTLNGSLLALKFQQTDTFDFSEDTSTHSYSSSLTTCSTKACGSDDACSITTNGYIQVNLAVHPTTDEILLSLKEGNDTLNNDFDVYIDGNYIQNYTLDSGACQTKNITIDNIAAYTADGEITLKLASPGPSGDFSFAQLTLYANNSYTTNPTLYIGNSHIWNYTSLFNTTETTNNFSDILNQYLSTCENQCTVPLNITSQSSGKIILSDLNLEYTEFPPTSTTIPDQIISMNLNKTNAFNLYTYFQDNNSDQLTFNYSGNTNITITIVNGSVSFYSPINWTGIEQVYFTATDGTTTNQSNNITLNVTDTNIFPEAHEIQCYNGSSWISCENINYNDNLQLRVNCTDLDGAADLEKASFTLFNTEDNNNKINAETTTNTGDWWIYNHGNIQESGNFNLTAKCYDFKDASDQNSTIFQIPFGTLSINLTNSNSNQHRTLSFNITTTITCNDAECGTINATLDPEEYYSISSSPACTGTLTSTCSKKSQSVCPTLYQEYNGDYYQCTYSKSCKRSSTTCTPICSGTEANCLDQGSKTCTNFYQESKGTYYQCGYRSGYGCQAKYGIVCEPPAYSQCTTLTESYTMNESISDHVGDCFIISGNNVVIDCAGYIIDGSGGGGKQEGIYVSSGYTNVTIKNCNIIDFYYGIHAQGYGGNIKNNTIHGNAGYGIFISSGSNYTIVNNSIYENTASYAGIEITGSSFNTIHNNIVYSHGIGIELYGLNSEGNKIHGNKFYSNDKGVNLESGLNNAAVYNNNITNSTYGIYIYDNATDNEIYSNNVSYNTFGIYIESSSDNTIYNNYLANTNNTFESDQWYSTVNDWNISITSQKNIAGGPSLGGNYYNDSACTDSNNDGFCDTQYNIVGLSGVDHLPLKIIKDSDGDGILDKDDQLKGTKDDVNLDGIKREELKIIIDKSENISKQFHGIKPVRFREEGKPILHFDHNFTEKQIDLSNLVIKKANRSRAKKGFTLIKGLTLSKDQKKTVYVDKISNSNKICVKDAPITVITEISGHCTNPDEYELKCPGSSGSITCSLNGTRYKIEGLSHSGVLETKGIIPMNSGSPFYTTSQNPIDGSHKACLQDMKSGDSCDITWTVTANASSNKTFDFFVFAKSINYSADINTTESNHINISTTNTQPTLASNLSDQSWDQETDTTINLNNHFNDSDNDPLSFSSSGNSSITITYSNGIATLTPTSGWSGSETVYFIANDSELSINSNNITLTVNQVTTSGSGGGGGSSSGKDRPQKISSFNNIIPDKDYIAEIDGEDLTVSRILFRTNRFLEDVKFNVEVPEEVQNPLNNTYKYFTVEKTNLDNQDLEDLRIEFIVRNEWAEQFDNITLRRFHNGEWQYITTKLNVRGPEFSYYVGYLDGFSTFAITGEKAKPEELNMSKETIITPITGVKKMVIERLPIPSDIPPIDIVILGIIILLLVFAAFLLVRLSKKPSKAELLNKKQKERQKLIAQREKLHAKLEAERRKDYEKRAKKAAKTKAKLLKEKQKRLAKQRRREARLKFLHSIGLYKSPAEKKAIQREKEARRQRIEAERRRIIAEKEKIKKDIEKEKQREKQRELKQKQELIKKREYEERARKAAETRLENEKIKAKEEKIRQKELEKRRKQLEKQKKKEAKIQAKLEKKRQKEYEERAKKAAESRRLNQLQKEKEDYERQKQLEEQKLAKEKEKALKADKKRREREEKELLKEQKKQKEEDLKKKDIELKRQKEIEQHKRELELKKEKIKRQKKLKAQQRLNETRKKFFGVLHSVGLYKSPAERKAIAKKKAQLKKEKLKREKANKRLPVKSIGETHEFIKKEHEKTKKQHKIFDKIKEIKSKKKIKKQEKKEKPKKESLFSAFFKPKKKESIPKEAEIPPLPDMEEPKLPKEKKKSKKKEKTKAPKHIKLPKIPEEIKEPEVPKEEPKPEPKLEPEKPKLDVKSLIQIAQKAIHAGHSREEIRRMMKAKGWDDNTIEYVISKVKISKEQMLDQHIADINSKLRNL